MAVRMYFCVHPRKYVGIHVCVRAHVNALGFASEFVSEFMLGSIVHMLVHLCTPRERETSEGDR